MRPTVSGVPPSAAKVPSSPLIPLLCVIYKLCVSGLRLLSCRERLSASQLDIVERHCVHLSSPLELPPGIAERVGASGGGGDSSAGEKSGAFCLLL